MAGKMINGRYVTETALSMRERRKSRFVERIPYDWVTRAANLSPKAFVVAVAIWYRFCLNGRRPFKLSNEVLKDFKIGRATKARALRELQKAGLVSVASPTGVNRSPVVSVVSP